MGLTDTTASTSGREVLDESSRAGRIIARCREIARYTETPGEITRTFLSAPMHGVHDLVRGWMVAAGMSAEIDAVGNIRGVLAGSWPDGPRVVLGSHLDTVPDGGAFDGILGVVLALAAVEELTAPLPMTVEVIGFSEEEGVRFRRPFLGSLAVTGALDESMLALLDANGISVTEAIREFGLDPSRMGEAKLGRDVNAYLEVHIEQGPVLEEVGRFEQLAEAAVAEPAREQTRAGSVLGVVDAVVGQSRLLFTFKGQANHAGTTPMDVRRDALAAACEWIVAVEALARRVPGLVATVGAIDAQPGAPNVIPGLVRATLDVRHAEDEILERAVGDLIACARSAGRARTVEVAFQVVLEQGTVRMDADMVRLLETAVRSAGHSPYVMQSGAGHDAMVLAPHVPSALLFLPSPGGLSHHPDEAVLARDVEAGLQTVLEFLRLLSHDEGLAHA